MSDPGIVSNLVYQDEHKIHQDIQTNTQVLHSVR